MTLLRPVIACTALFALLFAAPVFAAPQQTPEAFVTAFYQAHFAAKQRWDLTMKRQRAKLSPELVALLDEDARRSAASPGEIVGLDFDPIINAQEDATRFKVTGAVRDGDATIVSVSVYFGKEPNVVRVRLVPSGTSWKIANFLYSEGDLISILKETQAAA